MKDSHLKKELESIRLRLSLDQILEEIRGHHKGSDIFEFSLLMDSVLHFNSVDMYGASSIENKTSIGLISYNSLFRLSTLDDLLYHPEGIDYLEFEIRSDNGDVLKHYSFVKEEEEG